MLGRFELNGYTYINKGDFGSDDVPSSPTGANGIKESQPWWKKGVDQQFDDPLTYRNQLPQTPVEVQHVTYTDATPYYPTNDPFWLAYDENWLTVAPLSSVSWGLNQQMVLKLHLAL